MIMAPVAAAALSSSDSSRSDTVSIPASAKSCRMSLSISPPARIKLAPLSISDFASWCLREDSASTNSSNCSADVI